MIRTDKYPASVSIWGLSNAIDAVFMWENGHTYFFRQVNMTKNVVVSLNLSEEIFYTFMFRGDKYWRFDDEKQEVAAGDPPFPRPTRTWWFGC